MDEEREDRVLPTAAQQKEELPAIWKYAHRPAGDPHRVVLKDVKTDEPLMFPEGHECYVLLKDIGNKLKMKLVSVGAVTVFRYEKPDGTVVAEAEAGRQVDVVVVREEQQRPWRTVEFMAEECILECLLPKVEGDQLVEWRWHTGKGRGVQDLLDHLDRSDALGPVGAAVRETYQDADTVVGALGNSRESTEGRSEETPTAE